MRTTSERLVYFTSPPSPQPPPLFGWWWWDIRAFKKQGFPKSVKKENTIVIAIIHGKLCQEWRKGNSSTVLMFQLGNLWEVEKNRKKIIHSFTIKIKFFHLKILLKVTFVIILCFWMASTKSCRAYLKRERSISKKGMGILSF